MDTTTHYLANLPLFAVSIALAFAFRQIVREALENPIITASFVRIVRHHKLECAGCTALVLVAAGMMLAA